MATRTDAEIVKDWQDRLKFREGLALQAKRAHAQAQATLTAARADDAHPRSDLVKKRDAASDRLALRRRQVAEAERVIANHQGGSHVHTPLTHIVTHSNGFTGPMGHDGVDLISDPAAAGYAICDGVIVDVRSAGWWGKGAQASHGHPIGDGDGIVQLQCSVNDGPFRKGMVFGYGHAEGARVVAGQHVKAGEHICHTGFANAWHFHFMANKGDKKRSDGGFSGVGTMDPWPFVSYAISHQQ